jgi:hypothetical protein
LQDELFATKRNLWESDLQCKTFHAPDLLQSGAISQRIEAIEALCQDGIVVIRDMDAPESLDLEVAGEPLSKIANVLAASCTNIPGARPQPV